MASVGSAAAVWGVVRQAWVALALLRALALDAQATLIVQRWTASRGCPALRVLSLAGTVVGFDIRGRQAWPAPTRAV